MTPAELEAQDQRLRSEADVLLREHDILNVLGRFGTSHVTGSYDLHLMTWRDLDIYVEMPSPEVGAFLELGRQLALALRPRKMAFTDHLHFPPTEGLIGLYWGIRADSSRSGWKIDIWGVDSAVFNERLSYAAALKAQISDQVRVSILRIKNDVCHLPAYRDTITSKHVYDAVLVAGATTTDAFWEYISSIAPA